MASDSLDYYATPGRFTTLDDGDVGSADIREAVATVQGLLVYDLFAKQFYGADLSPEQSEAIHERESAAVLALARRLDDRPLNEARPAANRVGARCHAYSRMTVALLRAASVPARARCGFGAYFREGWFEDHWVAEYWNAEAAKWQMVDAQLDEVWRPMLKAVDDPLLITPQQFLTAGHAWQAWRRGELDEGRCGLSAIHEHGAHWIAGNLRLDLASLNKVEMLPWDVWGEGWEPGEVPTDEQLELFDEIAELTVDPDANFAELRDRYASDNSVRMNGTVFNVQRGQTETV